jgi:hypothetical protein
MSKRMNTPEDTLSSAKEYFNFLPMIYTGTLGFALLLAFVDLSAAQEDPSLSIEKLTEAYQSFYGLIVEVDNSGALVMDSGERIDMWALTDINIGGTTESVKGRYAFCNILIDTDESTVGDCKLVPNGLRTVDPESTLSLFHWLPDAGLARQSCSNVDMLDGTRAILHVSKYLYKCDDQNVPSRSKVQE